MSQPSEDEPLTNDVVHEDVPEENKSIIMGILAQFGRTFDLHRITLPTFILEPRSMLERITDFMSHPQIILEASVTEDPLQRFLLVVKYFLSGWHIRPKGVKKPYNPLLGEFFRAQWRFEDGSTSYYVAEQVSHHPAISAYFYANPQNHIAISGSLRPKSKLSGNGIQTLMHGTTRIHLTNRPGEEYEMTNPSIYTRGIVFGTMLMELGDSVTISCAKLDLVAEIEFKTKGFFSGTYNSLAGKVKRASTRETLCYLSGKWTEEITLEHKDGPTEEFLNIEGLRTHPKVVAAEADQDEIESRKLWAKVTAAMLSRDLDTATKEKTALEDRQRREAETRITDGVEFYPRFFSGCDDRWIFCDKHILDVSPAAAEEHLTKIMRSHSFDFGRRK